MSGSDDNKEEQNGSCDLQFFLHGFCISLEFYVCVSVLASS